MNILGLDIGGANLKLAHTEGMARTIPFALWRQPQKLAPMLRQLLRGVPPFEQVAVTMTGELCDCFTSKGEGVLAILDAVSAVFPRTPCLVWNHHGTFWDVTQSRAEPLAVASANWRALAQFATRFVPSGLAALVDIGSTTTDITNCIEGRLRLRGLTDPQRLKVGQLVYSGVRRTPICALMGYHSAIAAEVFATTLDVYLLRGDLAEDPSDCHTADGRPATLANAQARLARQLCEDPETCSPHLPRRLARRAANYQVNVLIGAIDPERCLEPRTILVAGSGEFVACRAVRRLAKHRPAQLRRLSKLLGPEISSAGCAWAVAVLAAEREHDR